MKSIRNLGVKNWKVMILPSLNVLLVVEFKEPIPTLLKHDDRLSREHKSSKKSDTFRAFMIWMNKF